MSRPALESEWELESELEGEGEWEAELEGELEGEFEGEEFLGTLRRGWNWLRQNPSTQRRVALAAARQAISGGANLAGRGLGGLAGGAIGGAVGNAPGAVAGATIGQTAGGWLGDVAGAGLAALLPEQELEAELELEAEGEFEVNPIRRAYPGAMMAHMGHEATRARSEAEAEAFLGALVPLAARLAPQVAPAVMRAAPALIRGVSRVGRLLRSNPATRPLVRAVPGIVRQTVSSLARRAAQGAPTSPAAAVRTLAQQTQRTLANPRLAAAAMRAARIGDARYHRAAGGSCATCGR